MKKEIGNTIGKVSKTSKNIVSIIAIATIASVVALFAAPMIISLLIQPVIYCAVAAVAAIWAVSKIGEKIFAPKEVPKTNDNLNSVSSSTVNNANTTQVGNNQQKKSK